MTDETQDWDWRWPETPHADPGTLEAQVEKIDSPYELSGRPPPLCYPGTPLDAGLMDLAGGLLSKQLNAIGSHTHGAISDTGWEPRPGEGGFETVQGMEARAVWMIAGMLGGTPKTVDGYFCGGATEANIQGMWIGRQWLRQRPDPMHRGVVVLTTPLIHYSVIKGADLLDIGRSQWSNCPRCHRAHIFHGDRSGSGLALVGMDDQGQMDLADLERVFRLKYEEGFRRFMIVPTMGTSALGSLDPIKGIDAFVTQMHCATNANCYVHVDAAFGGFTVPFVNPDFEEGFHLPSVMSIAVDADKMGQLPYSAGVFLCRKGLQSLIGRRIEYVRGHMDDTIPGSRSALAPVLAWFYFQKIGVEGQRRYVQACLDARDRLREALEERFEGDDRVQVYPHSRWTNFLPIRIDLKDGAIPEELREEPPKKDPRDKGKPEEERAPNPNYKPLGERGPKDHGFLAPYHLRDDHVPGDLSDVRSCPQKVYKLCIMPHTIPYLDRFVEELARVLGL